MRQKDKRKQNPGRPKMPKNQLKRGLSIKVKPALWDAIAEQTKGKNRNQELETVLEEKYLTA